MPSDLAAGCASLTGLLRRRATLQPDDRAYIVLSDRGGEEAAVTFAELAARAAGLAQRIAAQAAPGERALLVCPNGLGFLAGFFACLLAGVIPVPLMPPRRISARDAGAAILADCAPRLGLAPRRLLGGETGAAIAARFAGADLGWLAVDDAPAAPLDSISFDAVPGRAGSDIAFLQYTSGSTSVPKGVVVTHASVLANLRMIAEAFGSGRSSTCVSWVPLYHDMGLILNALHSLYVGSLCVLMAPVTFLQRPFRWLRAIGDYRAEIACAPNFAYDLCCERCRPQELDGVDLSGWRLALNGAEPVRAATLRRFAAKFAPHGFAPGALYPAYGLAEATVLVAGGRRGDGARMRTVSRAGLQRSCIAPPQDAADAQEVVGCGRALAQERIATVDPQTGRRLGPDEIGEIWVAGANVAAGYWRNPAASTAAFAASVAGEDNGVWLRTGDLGFLDGEGELFVTGRRKEVIIIRGINHYPQDIEETVALCHPALRRHGGAAFGAADRDGEERLVVVQEIERTWRHRANGTALAGAIRDAVIRDHDVAPFDIALLRPGALPNTTSGKIQRAQAREMWLAGSLERL